jgi:hypothetical protein
MLTDHAAPSGPRTTLPVVRVAGWTIATRPGRIYLHGEGEDPGQLQSATARAIAAALWAAAEHLDPTPTAPTQPEPAGVVA